MSASSTILLPHAPASVALARQKLCGQLRRAGVLPQVVDDVVLVASELISNSLRHARPLPSGEIRLSWKLIEDGGIEIAVGDGGAGTEPRLTRSSLSALGGRGLDIVAHVADRWGVRRENGVTVVWAVFALAVRCQQERHDHDDEPVHR